MSERFKTAKVTLSGLIVTAVVVLWLYQLAKGSVRPHPAIEFLGPVLTIAAAITFFGKGVVNSAVGIARKWRKGQTQRVETGSEK